MDKAVPRQLRSGEILFLAGEPALRVHLVCSGVLKLSGCDGHGRETILGLAVEGDLVGEMAALDGDGQPFDAIAAGSCRLLGLDKDLLLELIEDSPLAALQLARTLTAKTRWTLSSALERSSSEVPARLAGRLLDLAEILGRVRGGTIEMDLPLAQKDLGGLAGMCRESACKTMRSFRKQGVLDYQGRRLRILRPDMLERIRCAGRAARPSP
jgi:CRP-like cAMP-binding protein